MLAHSASPHTSSTVHKGLIAVPLEPDESRPMKGVRQSEELALLAATPPPLQPYYQRADSISTILHAQFFPFYYPLSIAHLSRCEWRPVVELSTSNGRPSFEFCSNYFDKGLCFYNTQTEKYCERKCHKGHCKTEGQNGICGTKRSLNHPQTKSRHKKFIQKQLLKI